MILGQTLDINGNIIQKAKFEPLATDPSAGSYIGSLSGAIYFNTTSGVNRIHNGTEWVNIAKIQGTGSNITVTYSGNPLVATLTLDSGIDAAKIANGTVSNTEFQYISTVTSNVQDQLNSKASTASLTAYQTRSEKGVANGYASLDSNGKVPTTQLPEEILGNMAYKGTWNATTNSPSITTASSVNKGWYYIVTVSGTSIPSGLNPTTSASIMAGTNKWNIGDWIVSDGTYWDKIDNTDQVMSVFGRMGAVVAQTGDYNASQITNTAAGTITATNVQNALNELDTEKVPKTTTITAGTGLTGGGDLSTNRTISLATTGTAGTYTKVTTNAYGQVTAGTTLTSADIPTLPTTKILETTTDRFVSDTQISSWDSSVSYIGTVSAEVANINVKFRENAAYGFSKLVSFSNNSNGQTVGILVDAFGYVVADDRRGTFRVFFGANQTVAMTSPAATPVLRVEGNESNSWTFGYTIDTDTSATKTYSLWCHHPANYAYLAGSVRYQGRPVTVYENQVPTSAVPSGYVAGSYTDKKLNSLLLTSLSTSAVVVTDGSKNLVSSPITTTELLYLDGTSANIQNQLTTLSGSRLFATNGADNRIATFSNSNTLNGEANLTFDSNELSLTTTNSTRINLDTVSGTNVGLRLLKNSTLQWFVGTQDNTGNYMVFDYTTSNPDLLITSGTNGLVTVGSTTKKVNIPSLSTSTVVVTDGSKNLVSSPITTTELGYLDGTSANIQYQLNSVKSVTDNAVVKNPTAAQYVDVSNNKSLNLAGGDPSLNALGIYSSAFTGTAFDFMIKPDGKHEWGPGNALRDTNLYRAGANHLKTDDQFTARSIKVSGYDAAALNNTGPGAELHYVEGAARLLGYDRTTIQRLPVRLDGSELQFFVNSTEFGSWTSVNGLELGPRDTAWHQRFIRPTDIGGAATGFQFILKNNTAQDVMYSGIQGYIVSNTTGSHSGGVKIRAVTNGVENDVLNINGSLGLSAIGATLGNLSTNAVVVTDGSKNLVSSPITTTELGYLDNVTSNIQTQLNNITNGTSTRYSTTINIASGVQSFTITHNLGYLRPNVTVIDEVSDREIMVTPIYTSTTQLSLPITSSQAFTGARVEVYI